MKFFQKKQALVFIIFLSLFVVQIKILWKTPCGIFYGLAKSFAEGKLYLGLEPKLEYDAVFFGGHQYWPLGPFPAVLLTPFAYLAEKLRLNLRLETIVGIVLVWLTFFVYFKLAQKYKYNWEDSLSWAFAFCFGSAYLAFAMVSWSYWFSHLVTVLLILLLTLEIFNKKRPIFLGMITALLLPTRITAAIGAGLIIFLEIISDRSIGKKTKLKKVLIAGFPVLISLGLLFLYNFARFHNIWETGYNLQVQSMPALEKAKEYGLYSLIHIPGNLYDFLLATPLPVFSEGTHMLKFPFFKNNPWGTSIFLTSPYLLYLFFIKPIERIEKILMFVSLVVLILISSYFGIGVKQLGYRYAFDFLPYIFIVFMIEYKKHHQAISIRMKFSIIFAFYFNFYLLLSMLGII